jgi:hypothetical protein
VVKVAGFGQRKNYEAFRCRIDDSLTAHNVTDGRDDEQKRYGLIFRKAFQTKIK